MTKCGGCGIRLQDTSPNNVGYTPNINNHLCERCFKLKNYNILTNDGVEIDNEKILEHINKEKALVLFLVDFLNINEEVIGLYNRINNSKMFVITKADLIPKNIIISRFVTNIKKVYGIKEEIVVCSSKNNFNRNIITNICLNNKQVILAGFTNAGKSSLINALVGSEITVSKRKNTTQDFIKLNVQGITIIDAPGFISKYRDMKISKSMIRPRAYQLTSKYHLLIDDISLYVENDSNLTIYTSNETLVDKRKNIDNVSFNVSVSSGYDLVINGIGFIKFSSDAKIYITTKDYEIRPSIIGGDHE